MHTVIKQARERERFLRETEETRRRERERYKNREKSDLPPVFNKRLFSAKSHIVITKEAKKILERNRKCVLSDKKGPMENYSLSNHELLHMKFIVEGLTFLHKGLQYVTECLAHVVTLEKYDAFQYIEKLPHEDRFSCFYILSGVVEVTYDPKTPTSFNAHDTNVVYPHTAGEYLALLSPEGPEKDLPAPATIYTVEPCEFLRVDRRRFHETIGITLKRRALVKMRYLDTTSVLRTLPEEHKRKMLPTMIKQTFPAEKVIIKQDEVSKFWFLVVSGRCRVLRKLYVPEVDRCVVFKLGIVDEGHYFGEDGVLDEKPSNCSIVAMGVVTCFRISKLDFDGIAKGPLRALLRERRLPSVSDTDIKNFGYDVSVWEEYKRDEILNTITKKPAGEEVVSQMRNGHVCVKKRPQTSLSLYRQEGMEEFLQGYQPRPKTAVHHSRTDKRRHNPRRSKTALGHRSGNEDSDDECLLVIGDRDPAEASVGFLPTAKMVFGRINTDLSRVESRDFVNDWNRHGNMMKVQGRLGWSINPADLTDKQDIRNVQLSTKYRDREESTSSPRPQSTAEGKEDEWTTPIHEANIESKKHLFVVRFRMNYLKRQLKVRRELRKRAEERKRIANEYLEKLKEKQNGGQENSHIEAETDDKEYESNGTAEDSKECEISKSPDVDNPHKPSLEKHMNNGDLIKEMSDSGLGSGASTPRKADDVRETQTLSNRGDLSRVVENEQVQAKNNRSLLHKRNYSRREPGDEGGGDGSRSPSIKTPSTQTGRCEIISLPRPPTMTRSKPR